MQIIFIFVENFLFGNDWRGYFHLWHPRVTLKWVYFGKSFSLIIYLHHLQYFTVVTVCQNFFLDFNKIPSLSICTDHENIEVGRVIPLGVEEAFGKIRDKMKLSNNQETGKIKMKKNFPNLSLLKAKRYNSISWCWHILKFYVRDSSKKISG